MLARLDYLARKPELDVGPVFSALSAHLAGGSRLDPVRCRVQLDWIQYKSNFRAPVAVRSFVHERDHAPEAEVAVDVRRLDACDITEELHTLLGRDARAWDEIWLPLEGRTSLASSRLWDFNRLYWEHLSSWETTFQQDYASSLPGGESDGTNRSFWVDRIGAFLDVLDDLEATATLPDEIYVLELGVGSGQQARVWLDTFRALDAQRGGHHYPRVRYLMADYSADVLVTAREATSDHRSQVSTLNVDAMSVFETLSFLRYKILFIHSCNLYDNLPTDEIALVDGQVYRVGVRAVLRRTDAESICREHGLSEDMFLPTLERLLRIGPEVFDDTKAGVRFWSDVWCALVLDERYEAIDPALVPILDDESITLDEVIAALPTAGRCHLSSGAVRSFADTLPLLHPRGVLQVQDLFVGEPSDYAGAFRGPGKLDGSVINWLNGPLFAAVAERLGYRVRLEPFTKYRERSNAVVLTTAPKD